MEKVLKKNILMAIPVVGILLLLYQNMYEILGKPLLLASFLSINKNIWESTKIGTISMIIWWAISYLILRKRVAINLNKWVLCAGVSNSLIFIVIPTSLYFFNGVLGVGSFTVNVFTLLLALSVGQYTALLLYKYLEPEKTLVYLGIALLCIIVLINVMITFYPGYIPICREVLKIYMESEAYLAI